MRWTVQNFMRSRQLLSKWGGATRAVDLAVIFIFDLEGNVLLQKRSQAKNHNAGLLDVSVGGHIVWGDTPRYTAQVEMLQEIGAPSIVEESQEQKSFLKTFRLLRDYTGQVAVVRPVDIKLCSITKHFASGDVCAITNYTHLYFGVYDGPTRCSDREAAGVMVYSQEQLTKEFAQSPEQFSPDLAYYTKTYKQEINSFIEDVRAFTT